MGPWKGRTMTHEVHRFTFDEAVHLKEAWDTLQLAILAVKGLFGAARTRPGLRYRLEEHRQSIAIDATEIGEAVAAVFTAFLDSEFEEDAYTVDQG